MCLSGCAHRGRLTDDDDHDDCCSASTWLEELGIDQSRYRSLDPAKVREYPFDVISSVQLHTDDESV